MLTMFCSTYDLQLGHEYKVFWLVYWFEQILGKKLDLKVSNFKSWEYLNETVTFKNVEH